MSNEPMETQDDKCLSDDSVDDQDDSDADYDEEYALKLSSCESQLAKEPFNYELHLKLIQLLNENDDLDKLRAARENMASVFPLTPKLWLDWIRHEINICLDDCAKLKIVELFERAVKDYTSVELWLEYCQFTIGLPVDSGGGGGGGGSSSSSFDRTRAVFEEACNKVGLHVQQGSLIFEAYREFELAIYSTMQSGQTTNESDEDDEGHQRPDPQQAEQSENQRQKIISLFRRQLSVPLFEMEKTLDELKEFAEDAVDENLLLIYQKALRKLESILPFEKTLCLLDKRKLADYEAYLNYEMQGEADPARIQILFERAVVDDCLEVQLWEKYVKYMSFTLKIDSLALPVYERSIRNCPWASSLWVSYLTCLEKLSTCSETIEATVEKAFNAGFGSPADFQYLWVYYLSYNRRRINFKQPEADRVEKLRTCFERARQHLSEFTEDDYVEPILNYWATVEVNLGNLQRSRELWQLITRQGGSSRADVWLNYANFEKAHGDIDHYRKALRRGLFAASDRPEDIGALWIQAELHEGSLPDLLEAQTRVELRMRVVNEKRERAAAKEAALQAAAAAGTSRAGAGTSRAGAQASTSSTSADVVDRKQKPKKRKAAKSLDECVDDKKGKWCSLDKDGFRMPLPVSAACARDSTPNYKPSSAYDDPLDEAQTVFLSNLAYEVDEERLREIFADVGPIKELRVIRDYKNRSKGFGYMVFEDIKTVELALRKDRTPVDGRPVFVSRCNERKQFEFKLGLEKNKLFVKNIPFDATKDELEAIFKQCGKLSDVRLCVFRTGKFRGMAYVDFVDAASASAAVVKLDGFELRGKAFSVAISNPPARKDRQQPPSQEAQRSRDSSMKLRLFVPRSVQSKSAKTRSSDPPPASGSETSGSARSNDDFRNMFLKK